MSQFMTTRSGVSYKQAEMTERDAASMAESMGALLNFLTESQRRQAEAEERRREAEEEEKRRRFEEERRRQEESERQLALIAKLLEKTTLDGPREQKPRERDAQVVRLKEKDDIETYLTTFERPTKWTRTGGRLS